jgi:hypothetical protein
MLLFEVVSIRPISVVSLLYTYAYLLVPEVNLTRSTVTFGKVITK